MKSLNDLTSLTDLEKLANLEALSLRGNPSLDESQINELQKALPNCKITHNAK